MGAAEQEWREWSVVDQQTQACLPGMFVTLCSNLLHDECMHVQISIGFQGIYVLLGPI